MRPELFEPTDRGMVLTALALAGVNVPADAVQRWTKLELVLAFDWAWREHLVASDHLLRRRDKPSFVTAAEVPR